MNAKEFQSALAQFSNRKQIAFLTGCVEHVSPICNILGQDQAVNRAIDLAWNYVVDGVIDSNDVTAIISTMNRVLTDDSPTALVYIAAAAELIIKSIEAPNDVVIQVLNNIEGAIDVIDEEAEAGTVEERQWQEQALEIISQLGDRSLTRDIFAELSVDKTKWLDRVENQ